MTMVQGYHLRVTNMPTWQQAQKWNRLTWLSYMYGILTLKRTYYECECVGRNLYSIPSATDSQTVFSYVCHGTPLCVFGN